MAKTIACKNCGKKIQSDFLSCPYCRMDLDNDTSYEDADNNLEDNPDENEEETEEYYEEDDYEEIELDEEPDGSLYEEEEEEDYYEEDDYEESMQREEEIQKEHKPITKTNRSNQPQSSKTDEFQPIKVTKLLKNNQQKPKKKMEKEEPYYANSDHYYDDILPEILDDIQSNKLETIAKIVGGIILVCFVMWYLIYFL